MQKRPGTSIQESSPSRVTLHTPFLQKRAVITCEVSFTREVFPRRKSGVQHNPHRSHSLGTFHCWESFITSGNDGNLLKSKFSDISQRSTLQAGLSENCHFRPLMSTFLPSHPASIIENFSTKFPFTAPAPSLH